MGLTHFSKVRTANKLSAEYNLALPDAQAKIDDYNQKITAELLETGAPKATVRAALLPAAKLSPTDLSLKWGALFLKAFNWSKRATNTKGQFLAYDHPLMISSRKMVQESINDGVHPWLILNYDQVWRAAYKGMTYVYRKPLVEVGKRKVRGKMLKNKARKNGIKDPRLDHMAKARQSITMMTSSWSDGTAGPCGFCVPDGLIKQSVLDKFCTENIGRAFAFYSEGKTHFMNAATLLLLMNRLYTDAFQIQREKHRLPGTARGMLLADAWTGNQAQENGAGAERLAWSLQNNVKLPPLVPGGWSAWGQPVDQLHHLLRHGRQCLSPMFVSV
jgi:hypothetical protein